MFSLLVVFTATLRAAIDADEVTSLPGWSGSLPSKMYSGYIQVPGDAGSKYYHYFFTEAEVNNPKDAPVALWLNGGPGSSSLIGFFTENGQYQLDDASLSPSERHPCGCSDADLAECEHLGMVCGCGSRDNGTTCVHGALGTCSDECTAAGIPTDSPAPTLFHRKTGWQSVANMIFLESPAGVGFSYCDYTDKGTEVPCTANDTSTAVDNHNVLKGFFQGFPEYSKNEFYITGESYAGIYIPTLAEQIMNDDKNEINLVGMAIGNGCWGSAVGLCSFGADMARITTQFYYGHSATSNDQYDKVVKACGDPRNGPGTWGDGDLKGACKDAHDELSSQTGNHEIYNYYDECYGSSGITRAMQLESIRNGAPFGAGTLHRTAKPISVSGALNDYPCGGAKAMDIWLSRTDVIDALHVKANTTGMRYGPRNRGDLRPLYKTLAEKYRLLIYSGDVDGCVPFIGTQEWTEGLGFEVKESWRPWNSGTTNDPSANITAGYVTSYSADSVTAKHTFHFATVKGAGHMVPEFKPVAALAMIDRFFKNEAL
jgi:carboxypeptidase C (cathepsin A)